MWSANVLRGLWRFVTLLTVTIWSQQMLCMSYSIVVAWTLLLLLLLTDYLFSLFILTFICKVNLQLYLDCAIKYPE